MNAHGLDLLKVVDGIRLMAIAEFKAVLIRGLVEDQLLTDLHRLASESLPEELRLVPEATLNWVSRHLDLSLHLQSGQRLEIPAHQLELFEWEGEPPSPESALLQVVVNSPGWKWRDDIIVPPRVALASPTEPETVLA